MSDEKNRRIFNLLFRHQVYLEGLKVGMSVLYMKSLKRLFASFAVLMARSRYSTLDQFSLSQLNDFMRQFQREQASEYETYINELTKQLKQVVRADTGILDAIFEDVTGERYTHKTPAQLWESITAEPNPANGQFVADNIKAFSAGSMNNVIAIIRQGYANGWTTQETMKAIAGENDSTFKDGAFSRFFNQNQTLVSTVIAFLSAGVQEEIASTYYKRYIWVSVMDSHTTLVCQDRNGVVYVYGEGPQPPAWYNCRSKTFPFTGEAPEIPKSYYSWLKDQPAEFQDDVLGSKLASLLRNGQLDASLLRIGTVKPLTIEQFAQKIGNILA